MLKYVLILFLVFLEIPFAIKLFQAHKNCEIIREVAILIIMVIILLLFLGAYKLGIFMIK